MSERKVSFYRNASDRIGKTCSDADILTGIKNGRWKEQIDRLRAMPEPEQKAFKTRLPCFTASGEFSERKAEGLVSHTGNLYIDLDLKENPGLSDKIRNALIADKFTYVLFTSCRGKGLVIGVRIDKTKHLESFRFIERYYQHTYGLVIDKSCKDVSRLRFISYDPDLFLNEHAEKVVPIPESNDQHTKPMQARATSQNAINEQILDSIIASGKLLGDDSYESWVKIAFALVNEFGETGRESFHSLSLVSPKYDRTECDRKFDNCLKTNRGAVTFASIVHMAKNAGVTLNGKKPSAIMPKNVAAEFELELRKKYGRPYYYDEKNKLKSLNESFWAGYHFNEHIELYAPEEKKFYRYDPAMGLYRHVSSDIIKQEISSFLLKASQEEHELEEKRTDKNLNAIVAHLRGIAEKKDPFDKTNKNYVHLKNGVIVFDANGDMKLEPFSPGFYSRNQSPIAFVKDAKCDRFLNELLLPVLSPEDAVLIQKYAGQCLLGDNISQRLIILDGGAGTGKSTIATIIQKIIGLENVTQLRTQHLSERFELYRFLGKTLLTGVDVPGNFLSEKGAHVIKGLCGGDILTGEQKGGNGVFLLHGNFNIIITSNSRLQVKFDGDIGAWKRRLLIVRFELPLQRKKIPNFADMLVHDEGSGILNWALEGLRMLFDDIRQHGDIYLHDGQNHTVDGLLSESDSLRHFMEDCVTKDVQSDLSVNEIIEAYAEYCPAQGWSPKPITIVHRELEKLMLELFGTAKVNDIKRNGKNIRGFSRISWKTDGTDGYFKPLCLQNGRNQANNSKGIIYTKEFEKGVRTVRTEEPDENIPENSKLMEGAI